MTQTSLVKLRCPDDQISRCPDDQISRSPDLSIPFLVSVLLFSMIGCGTPEKVERALRKPDLILTVGYLNLSSYRGRIERKDLVSLSGVLKKEKIDILGVTGITRYPGVATRTDFVDVLSSLNEMRNAFALASDNSGRQRGNAVFSVYPLHSSATIPFNDAQADESSSAVLAVVDGGVSEIQIISVLLPSGSSDRFLRVAIGKSEESRPLLLLGNLPRDPSPGFTASPDAAGKSSASPIWVRQSDLLELQNLRATTSVFGELRIARVGLFRAGNQ